MLYKNDNYTETTSLKSFDTLVLELKSMLQDLSQKSIVDFEDGYTETTFHLGFRFSPSLDKEVQPLFMMRETHRSITLTLGGLIDKEGDRIEGDNTLTLYTTRKGDVSFSYENGDNGVLYAHTYLDTLKHLSSLITLHYQELLF
jgi:hypothetical protein